MDIGALLSGMFTPGQGNPFSGAQGGFVDPTAAIPPPMPPAIPGPITPAMADVPPPVNVGAALTGAPAGPVPLPRPRPGAVQGPAAGPGAPLNILPPAAQADPAAAAPEKTMGDRLTETLKGVKMPAGPELQRLATPGAPRPSTQIRGGDLMALLAASGGQAPGGADYKLPSTLGLALAGRR